MSEQADFLKPLITAPVKKLAEKRLVDHVPLVKEAGIGGLSREEKRRIKIALLLVHLINPHEEFFAPEEALLRGISSDTLAKRKEHARLNPTLARAFLSAI